MHDAREPASPPPCALERAPRGPRRVRCEARAHVIGGAHVATEASAPRGRESRTFRQRRGHLRIAADPQRFTMDHYIPKRRIPVTLWTRERQSYACQVFLDLDASGNGHQTLIEKLNESTLFLPVAVGAEGRIHL